MKNIRTNMKTAFAIAITVLAMTSCKKDTYDNVSNTPPPAPEIQATFVKGSGDITNALAQFRHLIGDSLNTKTDASPFGRREINWDAVPANFTNTGNFPLDFFNNIDPKASAGRKRGFVLSGDASFRVDSTNFSDITPSYANQFEAFSPKRTFAPIGSNMTYGTFKIPGTPLPATVKGFGVIFSDVDIDDSTSIEYFNKDKSLGIFKAPRRSAGTSFSFVGVFFPNDEITLVKITSGNGLLAPSVKDISDGGGKDLVVMDDFLYTEPTVGKVAL
jgi:hypothetical protein